jgi:hypothetical protein
MLVIVALAGAGTAVLAPLVPTDVFAIDESIVCNASTDCVNVNHARDDS